MTGSANGDVVGDMVGVGKKHKATLTRVEAVWVALAAV